MLRIREIDQSQGAKVKILLLFKHVFIVSDKMGKVVDILVQLE
jgi:hypothetical protein